MERYFAVSYNYVTTSEQIGFGISYVTRFDGSYINNISFMENIETTNCFIKKAIIMNIIEMNKQDFETFTKETK